MAVKLSNLVRVEDIVHAFKNEVPMYTADGVHSVRRVTGWITMSKADVLLRRVDADDDDRPSRVERVVEYQLDGRLCGWTGAHHMTIMADAASASYTAAYPRGAQPDAVRERDIYLREVMYPRMSEHEMD